MNLNRLRCRIHSAIFKERTPGCALRIGCLLILLVWPPVACLTAPHHRLEESAAQLPPEPSIREKAMTAGRSDGGTSPQKDEPVPATPEPWMKKPPCDEDLEEKAINGACWQATPRHPPCGQLYRWGSGCYRPLNPPKPDSISSPP